MGAVFAVQDIFTGRRDSGPLRFLKKICIAYEQNRACRCCGFGSSGNQKNMRPGRTKGYQGIFQFPQGGRPFSRTYICAQARQGQDGNHCTGGGFRTYAQGHQ